MRLAALEAQVVELKTENELLKMLTPLEAITEGLKAATPAEVESWMAACEQVADKMPTASNGKASKASKASKTKLTKEEKEKKNTNPTGPAEFNILIQAVWHEMAADAGVVGEHDDAFKKASKEVGVTFQKARAEASRRKAEMEGKPAPVPKVAAPKVAAPKVAAPKVAAPKVAAPKPVSAPASPKAAPAAPAAPKVPSAEDILAATPDLTDALRSKVKAECEGYGWEARLFDGKACWLDAKNGDIYEYAGENIIGAYDAENDQFCLA